MKKQLLVLIALYCSNPLWAKSSAALFIEFNTMEKGHKNDWFNFMETNVGHKVKLLKGQHNDWVDFRNHQIKEYEKMDDCSKDAKETHLDKKLHKAIALHEKHVKQWEKLTDDRYDETKKLCEKHKKELMNFKDKLDGEHVVVEKITMEEIQEDIGS
jgi:hypothetical protein